MKILCFGSLNIDYTYRVDHFVGKGETLSADSLQIFSGGKGLNQAIALVNAGADTYMAGSIGEDGLFLLKQLEAAGVHTEHVRVLTQERTGNAITQNDREGDNCILLYGGANRAITREQVDRVLADFLPGDYLILQNEINEMPYIMETAHARGLKVVLNPSPMEYCILEFPLEYVDYLILNEVEAVQLLREKIIRTGEELSIALQERFPGTAVVLTLGEQGSVYRDENEVIVQPVFSVQTVDTTAAGDTFTGFFIAGITRGQSVKEAMELAAKAAAIAVTRPGASPSIPLLSEVKENIFVL
ncbi:MAG: ribokinase [Lachnospiraceae bacterium]|nr:ribokinase [Lachnospiraceae bacterium]